jgi:hypothetical protein
MLTKMVKAFAGVRMDQSILALFDNDAAGLAERNYIDRIQALPTNIKTFSHVFFANVVESFLSSGGSANT